jgi:hypothetical protein
MGVLERELARRGRHALSRQHEHGGGDQRGTEVQKTAARTQHLRGHRQSIQIPETARL